MTQYFEELINKAILVEKNMAELYILFYESFEEDSAFWWQMAIEEENHAALLKTARQMVGHDVNVPHDLFPLKMEELDRTNDLIRTHIEQFQIKKDRTEAFRVAYRLEQSAGELHYNDFMKDTPESPVTKTIQRLNGADLDHAERIRREMERSGISPE